jgi:predicted kinase
MEIKTAMDAFILVGAPGSGKSTYAGEIVLRENANIISGDSIREELYGDASIQGVWTDIHDKIEEYVAESAERGIPVILDGTHYLASYRAEAITLLRSYGYTNITAVVIEASLAKCLAQNFKRKRHVPDYVIKSIHEKLQVSLKHIDSEGFSHINYIY